MKDLHQSITEIKAFDNQKDNRELDFFKNNILQSNISKEEVLTGSNFNNNPNKSENNVKLKHNDSLIKHSEQIDLNLSNNLNLKAISNLNTHDLTKDNLNFENLIENTQKVKLSNVHFEISKALAIQKASDQNILNTFDNSAITERKHKDLNNKIKDINIDGLKLNKPNLKENLQDLNSNDIIGNDDSSYELKNRESKNKEKIQLEVINKSEKLISDYVTSNTLALHKDKSKMGFDESIKTNNVTLYKSKNPDRKGNNNKNQNINIFPIKIKDKKEQIRQDESKVLFEL